MPPGKPKPKHINKIEGKTLADRLNKKYGKKVIFTVHDSPQRPKGRIRFSSHVLNRLSSGGIMIPRMHQLFGPEGVFKSTGLYDLIGNAQRARETICVGDMKNARAIYLLDSEGGGNESYMSKFLDVEDPEFHIIDNYESADEAVDIMVDILKSGECFLLAMDSLTTLQSSREDETPMHELIKLQGWNGKFVSGLFKKLHAANTGVTAVVFVNQIRDLLGDRMERITADKRGYSPTGGWAPRFYPSLSIEMQHNVGETDAQYSAIPAPGKARDRKPLTAWTISARVEKTRLGGNDQQELFFRYSPKTSRVDHELEILNLGMLDGIIFMSGSWVKYKLKGMKEPANIGQGLEGARMALLKDRKLYDKLVEAVDKRTQMIAEGEAD
jgi:RecA/RadA recombinase